MVRVPQAKRRLWARLQIGASDPLATADDQLQSGLVLPLQLQLHTLHGGGGALSSLARGSNAFNRLTWRVVQGFDAVAEIAASEFRIMEGKEGKEGKEDVRPCCLCRHQFIFSAFAVNSSDK